MEKGKKEQKGGGQRIGNERNMNGVEVDRKRRSKGKCYGILGHVFEILVREKEKNGKEVWTESEQTYKGKGVARSRNREGTEKERDRDRKAKEWKTERKERKREGEGTDHKQEVDS